MSNERTIPVSRSARCVICDGDHKCSRKEDGLILCGRPVLPAPSGFVHLGPAKGNETFALYRRVEDRERRGGANGTPPVPPPPPAAAPPIDWRARAATFAAALTPELRLELAQVLGLPEVAIAMLPGLGWHGGEQAWTFPEVDGAGKVVAINRRFRDGEKRVLPGGTRGLTVLQGWDCDGTIYIVEGASDTLTLHVCGLTVLGQPNNYSGHAVEQLAAMLRGIDAGRAIVVVGEYDPKRDGKWPGRDGATKTAIGLMAALNRPVSWCMPPDGAKDSRAWARTKIIDREQMDDWEDVGAAFVAGIWLNELKEQAKVEYRFNPIDFATFMAADYRREWLVKRLLVRGEPGIVAGTKKSLKTNTGMDLAISLASGSPFLGEFTVYRQVKVAFISGESGKSTLQETAGRIADAKLVSYESLRSWLYLDFRLPQLGRPADVVELRRGIEEMNVEVLLLDPVYLALLSGGKELEASNLFHVGPQLLAVATACLDVGVTPILYHHAKKNLKAGEPIELEDISFAGFAEFARQWGLLSRREEYVPGSGLHKLWFSVGGSAGQSGQWALDIDEGQLDEDFRGRKWDVKVSNLTRLKQTDTESKQCKANEARETKEREWEQRVLRAIDAKAEAPGSWVGRTQVKEAAGLNTENFGRAIFRLQESGVAQEGNMIVPGGKDGKTPVSSKAVRRKPVNLDFG